MAYNKSPLLAFPLPSSDASGVSSTGSHSAPLVHAIPTVRKILGGVGRTTVYGLIKSGELRTIKIGARTFVPDVDVQRVVTSRLQQAA